MEKLTATYHFVQEYEGYNRNLRKATVKLDIDYKSKTFSVTPPYGEDKFVFKHTSHNYKMWLAVLSAMRRAIEFANVEIGVTHVSTPADLIEAFKKTQQKE